MHRVQRSAGNIDRTEGTVGILDRFDVNAGADRQRFKCWITALDNCSEDERQACTAILSNLESRLIKCVVARKEEEWDTADKIFIIPLNRFGSGMKGHQAMMRFAKRRQRDKKPIA